MIVWKQIIAHAKDKNIKNIVFITNDNKEDWWLKNENKTIGVRYESRDEIYREGKVDRFKIYSSEKFIEYANKFLNANISESVIEEIRDIRKNDESLKAAKAFIKASTAPMKAESIKERMQEMLEAQLSPFENQMDYYGKTRMDEERIQKMLEAQLNPFENQMDYCEKTRMDEERIQKIFEAQLNPFKNQMDYYKKTRMDEERIRKMLEAQLNPFKNQMDCHD